MEHKPDYHIEKFWLSFKDSMGNFYKFLKVRRPIDEWSEQLNRLQKNKKYLVIEEKIRNYMCLYAIDLMRLDWIGHDSDILKTNIKRWNKISSCHLNIQSNNKYHNVVFVLFDIYCSLVNRKDNKEILKVFSEVELFIVYQDFTSLIEFAVKTKMYSIIDKLYQYCDISKKIKDIYNIEEIPTLKTKKLVNFLHNTV